MALAELSHAINELQTAHLEGFFVVAGDFNHRNLKTFFPKFHQHVTFPTRGENCLDKVYTNMCGAYIKQLSEQPEPTSLAPSEKQSVHMHRRYRTNSTTQRTLSGKVFRPETWWKDSKCAHT